MNIIKKRPNSYNLARNSISFNDYELPELFNSSEPSAIHVFDNNNILQAIIPQEEYKNLQLTTKIGFSGPYICANFSECRTYSDTKHSYTIPAKRNTNNDPRLSFTYRTNDLIKSGLLNFEIVDKQKYLVTYNNGETVVVTASRKGATLYSGKLPEDTQLRCPEKTGVVHYHSAISIEKL